MVGAAVSVYLKRMEAWIFIFLFSLLSVGYVLGIQEFIERPQNTSALQGQSAILRCVVRGRTGNVQWARDGFVLGYDPKIPGFSRYQVISSTPEEFNLQIVNSTLYDDAQFQCQVGPSGGDPPLMAGAYLTILVPPSLPQIVNYANGSVVEVSYTEPVLQLTCLVNNGRPAATIEWRKNGELVESGVEYNTEPIPNDKRENARSLITIRPEYSRDNNAVFICRAMSRAIPNINFDTFVLLSILYPPGRPTITGYITGEVVHAGSTLRLTCVSTGGNPLARLHWFRNEEEADFSYNSGGNKAENEMTFEVQPQDNDVLYRCEASNRAIQTPLTNEVILIVHFPPIKVTASGQKLAKAGERVTLTCESSSSNPPAVITWFAKGRQLPETTTRVEDSPDGGSISKSEVQVQLTEQENNIIFTCQATNPAIGRTVADTITLSVLYPPAPPFISGYEEGTSFIKAGDVLRMTCESLGGNPVATVKWYKGTEEIESDKNTIGSSASIAIITEPSDNGAIYKCTAENEATDTPLEKLINITVRFPPASVNITMIPAIPHAGEITQLICVCESSNPPAVIAWVRENRNLNGSNGGTTMAENGGKSTKNILEIKPTSDDHGAVYGCGATNVLLKVSVNDAITLDVLFKPVFDEEQSPAKVTILEDEAMVVNYTAKANPSEVTYTLLKNGEPSSDLTLEKGEVTISGAKRTNSGDYGIQAVNDEGTTIFNFSLNVQFPAEISDITTPVKEELDGTAFFSCTTVANPVTDNMVSWSREGFDMSKTKQNYEDGKAFLTVYELEKTDTGDFTCLADNGLGVPVTKTATLIVMSAPDIDKSPELTKAASEKGSAGRLICRADGAPVVSFRWIRYGMDVVPDENKYVIEQKVEQILYENVLIVIDVTKDDYGVYICVATNSKGEDTFEITLDGTSKPDPPYDIKVVNATHNTMTLSWKPGFDGGLPQRFRVRYKSKYHGYVQIDIQQPEQTVFTVTGLRLGTEYEMTVQSFNILGSSKYQVKGIDATTSKVAPPGDIQAPKEESEDAPIIIILVVCVVGIVLLALNVALILFFVRRRKKRMETSSIETTSNTNTTELQGPNGSDTTSHTNTIELYNGVNKETPLYPISPTDDNRSYGTYDKSIDEYSDDYKGYDEDDLKKVFIPTSDYGSVTYIPNKMDSPNMNSHQTYLDNSDRHMAWQYEDPYKVAIPRKKNTFDSEYPMPERSYSTHLYDSSGRVLGRQETRPKSIADLSDRSSRPASRSGQKTPPAPPTRSSSKDVPNNVSPTQPPLPARNYDYDDMSPRYVPPPGSLGTFANNVNVVSNPTYDGPNLRTPSPRTQIAGDEMRGHLV